MRDDHFETVSSHAEAWFNQGLACQGQGNFAEAETHFRRALHEMPRHVQALNYLGIALVHQGRLDEATRTLQQALQWQPDDADTLNDLGSVHLMRGQIEAAIDCYRQVLRIRPKHALAHYNLGLALHNLNKLDETIACYQQALALQPDHLNARINLGVALSRAGRLDEAVACYRQVLRSRPDLAEVHANLGKALAQQRQWDAASACYGQALRLLPHNAETHFCLGIALTEQNKFDEALASYEQTLRLAPEHAEAHLNRGFVWLLRGNWAAGWREFEWRLKAKGGPQWSFRQPRWDGSPLAGRTILVVAEQGYGDTLHFFRYVRQLENLGGQVLLQCEPALERLLGNSVGRAKMALHSSALPEFDVYVPYASLPGIMGTTPAKVPADVPYLRVDEDLVRHWHGQLQSLRGLKVGITWQGNPTRGSDRERSIPLVCFARLAQVEGVQLVSIQKGPAAEQLTALKETFRVVDVGDKLNDFMDTAAVVKNLDLVVCCDTSIAHLAGALGIPVWVGLATRPDWRWQLQRDDSPWYPTMRLFRQTQAARWTDVFDRMAAALEIARAAR